MTFDYFMKPKHACQTQPCKAAQIKSTFSLVCANWNEASRGLDSSISCFQFQSVQLVNQTLKSCLK